MALTKVSLINDGVIVVGHLHTNHGITTDNIGQGSNKYYSDTLVQNFLTTNNYVTSTDVATSLSTGAYFTGVTHDTVGRSLTFTKSNGATDSVNLTQYIDDTNLARLVSGTINASTGIATFTRDDSSTFTVDFSALLDDTNDYVSSAAFNTSNGILTLTRFGGTNVTVDLDGRYLQSFTETDPTVPSHVKSISTTDISNWNTAYGWGDHSTQGYLTSFTETDPTVSSHVKGITTTNISNWNTAYGWGNHSGLYLPISGKAADSELLDGIDSSRIIYGSNSSGTNDNNYSDWNTLDKTGFYSSSGAANRWSSAANWSSVLHFKLYDDNNLYASQLGFNTYDNRIYARTNNSGTWTAWDEIITTANIGSQSVSYATNAGTLDSLDSAEFARGRAAWQQLNFDSIKQPGLYQYDDIATGGGTVPPDPSPYNFRTIEIGSGGRYSQVAFGYNTDSMYFRRHQDTTWSDWRTVIHDGNIGSQSVKFSTTAGDNRFGNVLVGEGTYKNTITPIDDTNLNINTPSGAVYFNTYTVASGSHRAPIFYDSNDTNLYLDPTGTSVLNYINGTEFKFRTSTNNGRFNAASDWGTRFYTDAGYIQFGPANSGHAHIYTDRPNFYFNKDLLVNNQTVIHSGSIGSQSVNYASSAGNADTLDGLDSSAYMRDDGWNTSPGQDADTQTGMRSDFSYSNNAPHTGDLIRFGSGNYSLQLSSQYSGSGQGFSFRTKNGDTGTWNPWYQLIHSGNIGSQSVSSSNATTHYSGRTDGAWYNVIWGAGNPSHLYSCNGVQILSSQNAIKADIFYDSNTTYYVDPASTSNLSGLTVAAQISGSVSGSSNSVAITGYGNGNFTFHQSSGAFDAFSGWHNYFIGNHGSGASYYHTMIAFPFWGSPRYSRREGGTLRGPYEFWTSERTIDSSYDIYAPVYYDKNNTSYYINPDGGSYLLGLTVNGSIDNYGGVNIYSNLLVTGNISGTQAIGVNKTSTYGTGIEVTYSGSVSTGMLIRNNTGDTDQVGIGFYYSSAPQGPRGWITIGASSVSYNTGSDYRLKENLTPITDGIERVKLLQPKRFNFISEPDKVVDGFVAHETQEVVPEAVTGTKDAVDEEGNPKYQGIDQAKLVPLLTAALQEAIAKIENLEARIQTLEGQ